MREGWNEDEGDWKPKGSWEARAVVEDRMERTSGKSSMVQVVEGRMTTTRLVAGSRERERASDGGRGGGGAAAAQLVPETPHFQPLYTLHLSDSLQLLENMH